MAVTKYRAKLVVIDAIIFWNGDGKSSIWECIKFCGGHADLIMLCSGTHVLKIQTLEGEIIASDGDYIIQGSTGELSVCKPDIFLKTYEEVK